MSAAVDHDLYQRVILDHNRKPRNHREMEDSTHSCDGYNPLCGDTVTVYLRIDGEGGIQDISFTGSGCAIFKSSASLMTTFLKGKKVEEAAEVFEAFQKMARGEMDPSEISATLGKLAVLQGVREYPSRIKCATLAWHAMVCALDNEGSVSTE